MILPDVNIFVYAHRKDVPEHGRYSGWLEAMLNGAAAFGVSDLVLSGFLRIVTHPKVFSDPTPRDIAEAFVDGVRGRPNAVVVRPGDRHWGIFLDLCRRSGARGNLVPDAYLAAMAVESGCEWVTTDRDFARFPGLNWRTPFATH